MMHQMQSPGELWPISAVQIQLPQMSTRRGCATYGQIQKMHLVVLQKNAASHQLANEVNESEAL
jgi:hypothetical protein